MKPAEIMHFSCWFNGNHRYINLCEKNTLKAENSDDLQFSIKTCQLMTTHHTFWEIIELQLL